MRSLTKSTLAFAKVALEVGKRSLPDYSHINSPQMYTQPQVFAMLCLKHHLRTDYRGLTVMLSEWSDLREALGLKHVPHYSTLCYAEHRMLKKTSLRDCCLALSNSPA